MKAMLFGLLTVAGSILSAGLTLAGQAPGSAPTRWEYRVLTKDQVLDLANKDLTVGLNKLGNDGWDLAAVDGVYIFKRAKTGPRNVEEIKQRVALAEDEVQQRKERVAWMERMAKKGFLTNHAVEENRAKLNAAEVILDLTRRELEAFGKDAKDRFEKLPMPK
jgi:hypothetical protein